MNFSRRELLGGVALASLAALPRYVPQHGEGRWWTVSNSPITPNLLSTNGYPLSAVAKRTANFTAKQSVIGGQPAYPAGIGFTTSVDTARVTINATDLTIAATDSTFHSINGVVVNLGTSFVDVDGTSNTGSIASGAQASQGFRICRDQGGNFPLDGIVMEVGVWSSTALSSGQISSLQANQHGTNGYNF